MKLSILSDEVSQDFAEAAPYLQQWGVRFAELRGYEGRRAPRGMAEEDAAELRQIAADHGITFSSISPGLFKQRLDHAEMPQHRGDLQTRCLDLAEALGVGVMVVFPPIRGDRQGPDDYPPQVVEDFRALAESAAARGLTVAVENEPICFACTGASLARFLASVGHPAACANWDLGNDLHSDERPFPDGYGCVKPYLAHVHVKDNRRQGGKWQCVPAGEGEADWPGQLRALQAEGYGGFLVVETHFRPPVEGSERAVRALQGLLRQIGIEP
jgi:sugar phosphate isomerase/epimerase